MVSFQERELASVGEPKKYLILKIGAIGDVLMCLSVVDEIRSREPDAHITWICGKQVKPILELQDEADQILPIDESELLGESGFSKVLIVLKFWMKLLLKNMTEFSLVIPILVIGSIEDD